MMKGIWHGGERIIFHIDVNSAFLSWEAIYRLRILGGAEDLREIPSAVSGSIKDRHGIILAKSLPAKKYDIKTGETVGSALRKCPELKLVPPHYQLYEKCSAAFMGILREYTPLVEPYSVDEAFMDMTGTMGMHGAPVPTAHEVRNRIYEELGFTVNVGISSNKLLAKMASDFKKPNLVHTLFPGEIQKKMWPLPVSELFFVGRQTAGKLYQLGIRTIGDLANADPGILKSHLKKHGEVIYAFANGVDCSEVASVAPPNKGYGNSITLAFDVDKIGAAEQVLLSLCETVATRLRKDSVLAGVLSVHLVYCDFTHNSHQMTLDIPSNITNELYQSACGLLRNMWDETPFRQIGIHTGKIKMAGESRQLDLFEGKNYEKLEKLDIAIDRIRQTYGEDAVMRARFLKGSVYHMSGGIMKAKQTVDYSKVVVE